MTDEALRLALEALENSRIFVVTREKIKHPEGVNWYDKAITAVKAALVNEALERKAENARELGLDYEPLEAKDEPWECVCGANLYIDANGIPRSKASVEPATVMFKPELEAKDEPVAWVNLDDLYDLEAGEDGDVPYVVRGNEQPWPKAIPLYITPPQSIPQDVPQIPQEDSSNESAYQRGYLDGMSKRPQPLTDDQITLIIADCASSHQHLDIHLARAIEQAHGIK